jgi:hypothetical protein
MKKKLKGKQSARGKDLVSSDGATSARSVSSAKKGRVPNAETARILREAEEGKNLLKYANLEEMFEDLGI